MSDSSKAQMVADFVALMHEFSKSPPCALVKYINFDELNKLAKEVGSPFRLVKKDDNE